MESCHRRKPSSPRFRHPSLRNQHRIKGAQSHNRTWPGAVRAHSL